MAMNVHGSNPDLKVGERFERNIWCWSALWGYCASISPEAASLGVDAYLNDGHGLDAKDAKKLAATLREELATDATKADVRAIEEFEVAPPTTPATEALIATFHAAVTTRCHFSEQDVREFADFLEHSGGFEIY
jgi:hypothetical protein